MPHQGPRITSALRALEEARFGSDRTLNLRASLPTPQDATFRAEQWLRRHQAQQDGEVLVITGRGNQSTGGVSVVREAVVKLLSRLKRLGVIAAIRENTPGSFVVTLAPMKSLLESPRRHRGRDENAPVVSTLPGLDAEAHRLLERLARCALDRLGVRDVDQFLADEMRRQFSLITKELPSGLRGEQQLRIALARAIEDYEER